MATGQNPKFNFPKVNISEFIFPEVKKSNFKILKFILLEVKKLKSNFHDAIRTKKTENLCLVKY